MVSLPDRPFSALARLPDAMVKAVLSRAGGRQQQQQQQQSCYGTKEKTRNRDHTNRIHTSSCSAHETCTAF